MAGTSGSTKQVWGLLDKTRSKADSGGSSVPCMISITKIFPITDKLNTHQAPPCHTGYTRLNEGLGTSSRLPKTATFPTSFRHAWEAYEDDHYHKHVHFRQQGNLQYALMRMFVSPHKTTSSPYNGGVVTVSNNPQGYYARVQNACLQDV